MAKRGNKKLTSEDRLLWKKVTDTVTVRLRPETRDKLHAEEFVELLEQSSNREPMTALSRVRTLKGQHKNLATDHKNVKTTRLPLINLDRKTRSKLSKGKEEIDGRLDLHGMNQTEAHSALIKFLLNAQNKNWRNVLVITGKGGKKETDNHSDHDYGLMQPRGVLRQRVPQWLSDPQMRNVVLGFHEAQTSHGGSGALYVKIRKKRH